jgi:hypothetical protein
MPISSYELKNFMNRVFVECGSAAYGLGISSALLAGFEEVHSVEINPAAFKECQHYFRRETRVYLTHGDCGAWLEPTLNMIGEPCTIYLDANGWAHETESPFYSSVDALIRHGRKDHIVLSDDINHAFRARPELLHDLRSSKMIAELRRVNPHYTFYLIDTHSEDLTTVYPSWVLVADPINRRFPNLALEEYV